jgi:hypothetical protein
MISLALICSGLLAVSPPPANPPQTSSAPSQSPTPSDRHEYEAAREKVGRDPAANIQLALWCEAHGLTAERARHLAIAILSDPKNVTARGLMGLMASGGRWESPESVVEQTTADDRRSKKLAEYNAYRKELEGSFQIERAMLEQARQNGDRLVAESTEWILNERLAQANVKLGVWCERNDLKPESIAHYTAATQLNPRLATAWKHLGCRKHNGRWMTPAAIAAEVVEENVQRDADAHWGSRLHQWKSWLNASEKRDVAETSLKGINDPRAARSVWRVFVLSRPARQETAAQIFGQIDSPLASQALVMLALLGSTVATRDSAAQSLLARDPREAIPVLIDAIQQPLKLTYQVNDPNLANELGQFVKPGRSANLEGRAPRSNLPSMRGQLLIEGKRYKIARMFRGPLIVQPTGSRAADMQLRDSLRETEIAEEEMFVEAGQAAQFVERFNANAAKINGRALPILAAMTGQKLGDDSDDWRAWWADQQGYVYTRPDPADRPTYSSTYTPPSIQGGQIRMHGSCFGVGTLVKTIAGPRAIETITVGDQVLAQDAKTGELSYAPVVAALHNPPNTTLRLEIGTEVIIVTPIHRFWKAGGGWIMARDLKPGDPIRTVHGTLFVKSTSKDVVQPVYNLEVAGPRTFFVGTAGLLVHDHSTVEAVAAPFDAVPSLSLLGATPH